VVDPVIIAGCGTMLSETGYVESLKEYLLPNAVLATPTLKKLKYFPVCKLIV